MTAWTHDSLADDLAAHLKSVPNRMVWRDIQLGPSGSPRPDVYSIAKSYVRPCPTTYEVKISRPDFRADVTVSKWSAYLEYSHGVIFAVPSGMIDKREVPEICGLIVRHESVWRLAKRPTLNVRQIAQEALLKLLIDGIAREGPHYRATYWNEHDYTRKFAQKFGSEAARYVSDAACIERDLEAAQLQRQRIIEDAKKEAGRIRASAMDEAPGQWASLLDVLGLPADASTWDVKDAIGDLQSAKEGGTYARSLKRLIEQIKRVVANAEGVVS